MLDKNGIIQKSKDARREYGQAKANEQEQMDNAEDWIDEAVTGKVPLVKVPVGTKASKNGTINGEAGDSNNPTIPKGYIPIDTATSAWGDGSSAPSQDSVNHGLVIKDEKDNEWVWVPVPDITVMCDTSNTTEYTLCGTTGDKAVTTNKYSKTITIGTDSNKTTISRTTPGTTTWGSCREPDLVAGSNGAFLDAKEEYYKAILGFESKEKMAEAFVSDYNEMLTSIEKYGGFYIGRYELSEAGVQKDKETLTKTNWYNLYKKCTELNASEKVEARMIWGCQWDVTCNFIANKGEQKSITDSSSWGNYKGTSVKANDRTTVLKASGDEQKLNTGVTTFTMANNIYDLAGNCWEWTQEALSTNVRASRGGDCSGNGSGSPASSRSNVGSPGFGVSGKRFSSHFNNKVKMRV